MISKALKFTSLAVKIGTIVGILIFLTLLTSTIFFISHNRKLAVENAKSTISSEATIMAGKITSEFNLTIHEIQLSITKLLEFRELKNIDRKSIKEFIKRQALKNPNYFGISNTWEPNLFDNKDDEYAGLPGTYPKGRFGMYWYRQNDSLVLYQPTHSWEDEMELNSEWYYVPMRTKKPLIFVDWYSMNNDRVLTTTLEFPILVNNEFLGVYGIDFKSSFIQSLALDLKHKLFNGKCEVEILSDNCEYAANTKSDKLVGASIKDINQEQYEYKLKEIAQGKTQFTSTNDTLLYVMPLQFNGHEKQWQLTVAIPNSVIMEAANSMLFTQIIIGLLILLLSVSLIVLVLSKLLEPLNKLTNITETIAQGHFDVEIEIERNDEIGRLASSFKTMVLKISEAFTQLNTVINTIPDLVWLKDKHGTYLKCNKRFEQFYGSNEAEIVGKSDYDFVNKELADLFRANDLMALKAGEAVKNEEEVIYKNDGHKEILETIKTPLVVDNEIKGVLGIGRDITDRVKDKKELEKHRNHLEETVRLRTQELETTIKTLKEAQSQLIQSEKMASLGILTAGVAHEINNPLNYIMGSYVGLLHNYEERTILDNYEQVGQLINAMKIGIDRSTAIVQGLNQFSRTSESHDEECNVHEIIDNSLTMLHNQIKHYISVEKNYYNTDIVVKGNVGNLHQVFINIFGNAIQAIESKGIITVKTEDKKSEVIITIQDTGVGIPKENMKKLTDPFFTTKDPGKGTGLGLSITYNIIKEHKGELLFESEEGKGTTVKIKLPKTNKL